MKSNNWLYCIVSGGMYMVGSYCQRGMGLILYNEMVVLLVIGIIVISFGMGLYMRNL